jgi:CBS domain-containing protein
MPREIQARDIMQSAVISVTPSTSLGELRDLLIRHRIGGAPVVDENGELVGVISLVDIARVGLSKDVDDCPENTYFAGGTGLYGGELAALGEQLDERVVEEAMNTEVYTCSPDDRLSVLALTMRHHKIHRLIVTEEKRVVGIVTAFDLIQVLENH